MKYTIPRQLAIYRVGIELEGGWKASRGISPYGDGSVTVQGRYVDDDPDDEPDTCRGDGRYRPSYDTYFHCTNALCADCNQRGLAWDSRAIARPNSLLVGEICSQPLTIEESIKWLLVNYPDEMNSSCGMHVHVSLKSELRYSQLMDDEFRDFFRKNIGTWAKGRITNKDFWKRWRGENDYCKDEWYPSEQARHRSKGGPRYTFLNYCYLVHGRGARGDEPRKTLECRVFPVFQEKDVAAAVVCKFLATIETYLRTCPRVEQPVEAVAALEPEEMEEEIVTCA